MNMRDLIDITESDHNITDHEREKYLRNPDAQDPKLLVKSLSTIIDNPNMSDVKFREYVRSILPNFQEEFEVEKIDIK